MKTLQDCYHELNNWVTLESPHRLGVHARRHLLLYRALRDSASNVLLWCLCPKHHLFAHVAEAAYTNPRLEWNYSDEAEIGLAVKQAQKLSIKHLAVQLMQKYRATFEV